MNTMPVDFLLLSMLIICLWTDLKERKIYNKVVFPAAAAGVLIQFVQAGLPGLKAGLAGCGLGVLLFFLPFALGGLGAGDVKLLGAVGALKGPLFVVYTALGTALAGGVIALLILIQRRLLWTTVKRLGIALGLFLGGGASGRKGAFLLLERTPYSSLFPYGAAIFLGSIFAYCCRCFL